jgi:hypothetical protein
MVSWADPIAPRWRILLEPVWGAIPDKPSPMAWDGASKQLSIDRSISHAARTLPRNGSASAGRITLNFPPKGMAHNAINMTGLKRKSRIVVEPLRGIDVTGDKAGIHLILACPGPRRVKHGRKATWVEEFLVWWEPQACIFGEALEQYRLGFDITSITNMEDVVPSHAFQPFVSTRRLNWEQRRTLRKPPLSTPCLVQCVCVFVYMSTSMCVCVRVCVRVCLCACTCKSACLCVYYIMCAGCCPDVCSHSLPMPRKI